MHTARTLSGANLGVNKFGHNDDVDTGADEDIWTGPTALWVPPTQARLHGVVSTDNVDDKAGGDGALTVLLQGLDANWDEAEDTVILTGTTPVNTTVAFLRINRMIVASAGVDGVNAGAISAVAAVDATTTAHMPAGESQTQQAVYTVPDGFTALLRRYYCVVNPNSPAGVTGTVKLVVTNNNDANPANVVKHLNGVGDNYALNFVFPDVMPWFEPRTDIILRVGVSANDTIISGGFDVVLLPTT